MDSKELERLLAKYWACETSLEEEQMLRDHFRKAPTADEIRDAAALFAYFDMQRQTELQDGNFEQSIANMPRAKTRSLDRLIHGTLRIAAGIAVLVAAVWLVRSEIRRSTPQEMIEAYSDPELAFEETKRALLIISRGFGTAEEQARKLDLFNEAQQKIRSDMPANPSQSNEEVNGEP